MEVNFPTEYFRPEIRSGFYVDGMMKRVWASSMKVMLGTFTEVCEKYNIPWVADSGTLLGAVRHHGFIPWDDDVDVSMLRDDYYRFKEIMYDAFPDGHHFLTHDNPDKRCALPDMLTRVINTEENYQPDPGFLNEYFQCPFSAGIDIFPMDYIPDDPQEAEQYKNLCNLMTMGLQFSDDDYDDPDNQAAQTAVAGIEQNLGYRFDKTQSIKHQCLKLAEAVFSMYHRDECSRVASIWTWARDDEGTSGIYQKEWFLHPKRETFEGFQVPVVSEPEGYLNVQFGKDWRNEDRDFPTHDYPYYKDMEKKLISVMGGGDRFYYHFTEGSFRVLKEDRPADTGRYRQVLFLIPKASDWKYVKFYYDRLASDGDEVHVVSIPFYDCDLMRDPVQTNYEYGLFPSDINLEDYRQLDLSKEHYDEIVITFPYDEFNYTEMIEEKYFSWNLRNMTGKLTYISPFETSDTQAMSARDQVAMKHYVTVPALIYADMVYVQSENMKKAYINRLIDSWKDDCKDNEKLKAATNEKELEEIFSKKIKVRG